MNVSKFQEKKKMSTDIEDFTGNALVDEKDDYAFNLTAEKYNKIKSFLVDHKADIKKPWKEIAKDYRYYYQDIISKRALRYVYEKEVSNQVPSELIKKQMRSEHGVFVVSCVTSPYPQYKDENGKVKTQRFSCRHKCAYCCDSPGFPKSYLEGEPGVDRAKKVDYDIVKQIHERLDSYVRMGQTPDKIEIITLGGTFSEYPIGYRDEAVLDMYYGANTYRVPKDIKTRYNIKEHAVENENKWTYLKTLRPRMTLEEEIKINENHEVHVIGLTIETRPDSIDLDEIKRLRRYNCTRVQIGIQHTDNEVLKHIQRGHTIEDGARGIRLLMDNGFKVDIHLMPDLPSSSLEMDKAMVERMLTDPNLRADQWKVYPTSVVPWSLLEQWYHKGKYKPYGDDVLLEFLLDMKKKIPEWIRLNRVVRDIPEKHINGGCKTPHMRQILQQKMKERGFSCQCIRCRSVKSELVSKEDIDAGIIKIQEYESCEGREFFISYASPDNKLLYGFLRLRLPPTDKLNKQHVLEEIQDCALIRELHVYGRVSVVNTNTNNFDTKQNDNAQHRGIGKMLMAKAEKISVVNGYSKVAVIAGVGVRNYYRKLGYELDKTYMVKHVTKSVPSKIYFIVDWLLTNVGYYWE